MHVYFTPRARAALLRMARRWAATARMPEVFSSDLDAVVERLSVAATTGAVARRTARRTIFRLGTEKTRLHVYYVIDEAAQVVTVLQVWSQWRRRPPRL